MTAKEDTKFEKLQKHSNQFFNLNLNQNNKFFDNTDSTVNSFSKSSYNGKYVRISHSDICGIAAIFVMPGYKLTGSTEFNLKLWNRETKNLSLKPLKHFNFNEEDDEEKVVKKKRWMNDKDSTNKKNSSTLSLHIAAYENFIEASNGKSENLQKKSAAFKPILSLPKLQEPFDFPRQSEDESSTSPEVQQFTASQKLFSPKQEAGGSKYKDNGSTPAHPAGVTSVRDIVGGINRFLNTAMSSFATSSTVTKCDLQRTSSTTSISDPLSLLGLGDQIPSNTDEEESLADEKISEEGSSTSMPEKKSSSKALIKSEPSMIAAASPGKPKALKRLMVDSPLIEAKKEQYLVSDMISLLQQSTKPKAIYLYYEDKSCIKLVKNNKGQQIMNVKLLDRNGLSCELVAFPPHAELFEKRFNEIPSKSVIKIATDFYFYWPPNPFVATYILHKVIIGPRATVTSSLAASDACSVLPHKPDFFDLRQMIFYADLKFVIIELDLVDVITEVMPINDVVSVALVANSDSLGILKFGTADALASGVSFGVRLKLQNVQFSYSSSLNNKFVTMFGEKLGRIPSHVPVINLSTHSAVEVTEKPASYLLENVVDLKFLCPNFLNPVVKT